MIESKTFRDKLEKSYNKKMEELNELGIEELKEKAICKFKQDLELQINSLSDVKKTAKTMDWLSEEEAFEQMEVAEGEQEVQKAKKNLKKLKEKIKTWTREDYLLLFEGRKYYEFN